LSFKNSLTLIFLISLCVGVYSCKEERKQVGDVPDLPSLDEVQDLIYKSILEDKIDSLFNLEYNQGNFIGTGVSVVIEDRVVYEKTFGFSDFQKKIPLTTNSVFRIGSLSKTFTGVLAGILEQDGKISFDDHVKKYIPEFELRNDTFTQQLKLSHLLSHSSGLPYHSYTNLVEAALPLKKIIPYFKDIKTLEVPGVQYSYQNAAFALSGEVMSRATGRKISDLFKEELFKPLNMTNTSVDYLSISSKKSTAYPHIKSGDGWSVRKLNRKYYNSIPAGGVNISTGDMSKFLKLLLGQNPSLISKETLTHITKPYIKTNVTYRYYTKWPMFSDSYYGLGWRIHTFQNETSSSVDTLYHHGGMVNGYRSEIAFDPKEEFAIAVMFNSTSNFSKDVIPRIIEIIKSMKHHS
jgi:beta-lactamase class C